MEKVWHYLDNQFLNITRDSFKKAVNISLYHHTVLGDYANKSTPDPDLVMLYNNYHPLHVALIDAYDQWRAQGGMQEGSTLSLTQLLDLMSAKLFNWQARIGILYAKDSGDFKTLFPNGRYPFTTGAKDLRIDAVGSLSLALNAYPTLATLKAEVDAYHAQLLTARQHQVGNKAQTKFDSILLEQVKAPAMKMQYRNLGFLMYKYEHSQVIQSFFDVATIRESNQRDFTGKLAPLQKREVLVHTFMAEDTLRLRANGLGNITFYLSPTPSGTDGTGITILANQPQVISASQFGAPNYHTHRFLTAVNQSSTESSQYLVKLY